MASIIDKIFGGKAGDVSYEKAKQLASSQKLSVRMELAEREDIGPEFLYFLAEDPEPRVRRAIAKNEATPRLADLVLARDADEAVREDLAAKISKLAPGLSRDEQDKIRQMTYEALEILARDQVVRVRQVVAETLKDMTDAPQDVIRHLARDAELVVSGPVLENSPVLTDDDLLAIIGEGPIKGALSAISRRATVNEMISDAVYSSGDEDAIAALLGNASAQIREETLDKILDEAADVEPWHAPLVKRPKLPASAAGRLARFVADSLLTMLANRQDLDEETATAVRNVVQKRLEDGTASPAALAGAEPKGLDKKREKAEPKGLDAEERPKTEIEKAMEVAQALMDKGELNEAAIEGAALEGNAKTAIAGLAVRCGYKYDEVDKVVRNRSVKGIVSVAWKAGLGADASVTLQKKLCHVGGRDLLTPNGGEYPLSVDDMEWQLEFLGGM